MIANEVVNTIETSEKWRINLLISLRKHPFLLALRRLGRFPRRKSATQRQKFHTDDANQCLHNKSGSHGVPNINVSANFFSFCFSFSRLLVIVYSFTFRSPVFC